MSWDAKVCWDAAKAAGMLRLANVVPSAGDAAPLWVGFVSPDVILGQQQQSTQTEIEWWHDDLPTVAEGDQVSIGDVLYVLRENPYIPETCSGGEFRRVRLTQVR